MYYSLSEQLCVTLWSLAMGAVLGVIRDFFRLIGIVGKKSAISCVAARLYSKKLPLLWKRDGCIKVSNGTPPFLFAAIFAGDVICSLVAAAVYSVFLFHTCCGVIRWTYLAASFVGLVLYRRWISPFVVAVLEVILFFVRVIVGYVLAVAGFVFRPCLVPIKALFSVVLGKIKPLFSRKRKGKAHSSLAKTDDSDEFSVVLSGGRASKNGN